MNTYIVLDMEWNQPFSQKGIIKKPFRLVGEIVQIGAVKLDDRFLIVDTFKIMISPKHYTRMNRKVAKLTNITTEDLRYGFSFDVAIEYFRKWMGEVHCFLTWGADDIGMLRDNLRFFGLDTEWIPKSYNVQRVYNDQVARGSRQVSLAEATATLGLSGRTAHDALNDAIDTAEICGRLDMIKGLERYEEGKRSAPKRRSAGNGAGMRQFSDKRTAFSEEAEKRFPCEECGGEVRGENWITQNGDKRVAVGKCTCGAEFLIRLRARRNDNGSYHINRAVYFMNDELREYYRSLTARTEEKKEKAKAYATQGKEPT